MHFSDIDIFLFLEKNTIFYFHIFEVKEYKLHGVRNLQLYWTRFHWMHQCCMPNIITKDTILQQQPAEIQIRVQIQIHMPS